MPNPSSVAVKRVTHTIIGIHSGIHKDYRYSMYIGTMTATVEFITSHSIRYRQMYITIGPTQPAHSQVCSKSPHEILALDNQDTQIITVGPIE